MTYRPRSPPSRRRALASPVESLTLVGGVSCAPTGPETISQSMKIPSAGRSPSSVRTATVNESIRNCEGGPNWPSPVTPARVTSVGAGSAGPRLRQVMGVRAMRTASPGRTRRRTRSLTREFYRERAIRESGCP